jgi:hypothetical protein
LAGESIDRSWIATLALLIVTGFLRNDASFPSVNLAHLYILNLVVGYETFDHRHCVFLSLGSKKNAPFRIVAMVLTTRRPTAIAASD